MFMQGKLRSIVSPFAKLLMRENTAWRGVRFSEAALTSPKDSEHFVYRKNAVGTRGTSSRAYNVLICVRARAYGENNNHFACLRDEVVAERSLWDRLKHGAFQEPCHK